MSTTTPVRTGPFDQILKLEQEQEARKNREIASFEAAERAESETLREAEKQRDEQVRVKAREEFDRFKKNELPAQLEAAEKAAAAERTRIEKAAAAKKKTVVDSLVKRMLSSDTLERL